MTIVGTGYVGLVSGACFADLGHDVTCVDNDEDKIAAIAAGRMPIFEAGLAELVAANLEAGRLVFSSDLKGAVSDADVVFIAVGTPSRAADGCADLSAVYAVAKELAGALDGFTVVALKSTVPLGTCDKVETVIRAANPHADFAVVSNPEFLREGSAIDDFKSPNRIVIGSEDNRAREQMTMLYRPLSQKGAPMMFTGRRNAELIKYGSNAFLAMKITFINEMADLCESVGADVQEVARGIGLDKRIGPKFLNAGPGFGGSCFPKDTLALSKIAREFGTSFRLVETTIAVNEQRMQSMAKKIISACGGSVRGKTIAILGLTFKPNTDDMREAPALTIIEHLQDAGARIKAYDPAGMEIAATLTKHVEFQVDAYEAVENADAVVIATEWPAFGALDLARIKALMVGPVFADLRNMYAHDEAARHGFQYFSVGRSPWPNIEAFGAAAE